MMGFFIGVETISVKGIWWGIGSSITTAVHAMIIKKSLGVVDGRTFDLFFIIMF